MKQGTAIFLGLGILAAGGIALTVIYEPSAPDDDAIDLADSRRAYAKAVQDELRDQGLHATVEAITADASVLEIDVPNCSRSILETMSHAPKIRARLHALRFWKLKCSGLDQQSDAVTGSFRPE